MLKIRTQNNSVPGDSRRNSLWVKAVGLSLFLLPGTGPVTHAAEKPELEISEVVIEASAPALTGGRKDPVTILETQASTLFISDTVQRLGADAPSLLPAPDEPVMEPSGGCLAPFLGLGGSVKSRMMKAAEAWEDMRWQAVVDALTPVATREDDIPEKPEAYYFIGRSKHYLGDVPGAANAYEQLRFKYPDHPLCEHALYALSWIYLESGNPEKALEILDAFEEKFPGSGLMPYARYLGAAIMNRQHRYREALEYLEGIIAGYPLFDHLPEVQFWIAENQYFIGEYESAERNYDLYLRNYPEGDNRVEALYGRAFSRLEQRDYSAAMSDFKTLLDTRGDHPLSADAAFQAGKLAVFLKQEDTASAYFMKAIERSRGTSARTLEARGWLDYETEKFTAAAELFDQAAGQYAAAAGETDPRRSEMRFLAALSYFRAGEYQRAAERFEVLAEDTDNEFTPAALANAGVAWLKLRQLDRALQRLQEALNHPKPLRGRSLYMLYTAEVLFRLKRFDASIALFKAMEEMDDYETYAMEILRGLAWNCYGKEDWAAAAGYFSRVAQQFPDGDHHAEALLRKAECLFNQGEYDRAKIGFNALIAEYPLHPEAFEARLLNARADWIRGEFDRGMAALTEALRFAPDGDARQRVRLTIGELLQEQERYEDAIEQFRQAYLESPDGPNAPASLLKQADNLYNLGRYEDSAEVYRTITRQFADTKEAGEAQYSIGLTYFQRERLDEYLEECRQVAIRHPGSRQSALALQGAAAILVEQGRYSEAVDIQRTLLADYSAFVDSQLLRFRLGETLVAAGQYDAAEDVLKTLFESAPRGRHGADAALTLAEIALVRGNPSAASEWYDRVLNLSDYHPRRGEALRKAAELMTQRGRYDDAERLWKTFIREHPDSADRYEAHLALARIMIRYDRLDDASEHVATAVESGDRSVIAEGRLLSSIILEKQNDIDESLKSYLKINYLYPDRVDVVIESLVRAAAILETRGNHDQSRRMLEKAEQKADTGARKERLRTLKRELGLSGGTE